MEHYRISATQLDNIYRYVRDLDEDDYRHLSAEKLIQRLTVKDSDEWPLRRGRALHKVMENPELHYLPEFDLHAVRDEQAMLRVPEEYATLLLPPVILHTEKKYEADYNIDAYRRVTLVCMVDAVGPDMLYDYKFSDYKYGYDDYASMYQWRVNLLLTGASAFCYWHVQLNQDVRKDEIAAGYAGPVVCTVRGVTDTVLTPYPEMLEHVLEMCGELIEFCQLHGIEHAISVK